MTSHAPQHTWVQLYTRQSGEMDRLHEQVAELTEMLTAATHTALRRMKLIDQIRDYLEAQPPYSGSDELTDLVCDVLNMIERIEPTLDGADDG